MSMLQQLHQELRRGGKAVALAGTTAAVAALFTLGSAQAATPWTGIMPRADCAPTDRVETGLQGQTTIAERQSGASKTPYNCNLELVGQFTGEGTNYQMTWFDHCAYYGTR